ncbi:MAG: cytochrome c [Sulfurovum sp.]|nr:cytochrome c [Sulfurovaceae bacterium]
MAKKNVSVWSHIPFWRRSAAWVTGFASILLIWLTFDTLGQISMGTDEDLKAGTTKRVPSPTVINYKITYEMNTKRGSEIPIIGGKNAEGTSAFKEKELFFGKEWSPKEAADLLHLGKLTSQAKNCMNCHTLLGNGAYYAPDLTKSWLDKNWDKMGYFGQPTKEEGIAYFLQHPSENAIHLRRMPNLGITADEARGLVAFLKHMSSIDTNGFPRNFSKTAEKFNAGGTNAR